MNEQPKDRKDLKIQALLEKIANLTASYEDQVADLRVELTMVADELEKFNSTTETQDTADDEVHNITSAS